MLGCSTWRFLGEAIVIAVAMNSMLYSNPDEAYPAPPRVLGKADQEHALSNRAIQGVPSMAIAPKGRLWATWYAGKTEGENKENYVVVSTSGDQGKTWIESHIVDPDGEGPARAVDPQLWIDPDGRLWSFWAQTVRHYDRDAGVWAVTTDHPDAADPTWSKPRHLTDGIMLGKPTILSSGEWILPATCRHTDNSARVVVSTDRGRTWHVRGAGNVPRESRDADEHMIIERNDGSLWMLIRTQYGIGESLSKDRGQTWSPLIPSKIQHPIARFFIRRLDSGKLLLVKHGPITLPSSWDMRTGRSHLMAFLSDDDGKTWTGGLLLDERDDVSCPDGQQGRDGVIHIIYDYSRTDHREVLMARFNEDDIIAADPNSGTVSLKMIVSKPSVSN